MRRSGRTEPLAAAGQAATSLANEIGDDPSLGGPKSNITPEMLDTMAISDLAELPPAALCELGDHVEKFLNRAKARAGTLRDAIHLKYGVKFALERSNDKLTGRTRVDDGEWEVISDVKKNVEWDQDHLKKLWNKIAASGEDPNAYIKVTYGVAEAVYAKWSDAIKAAFDPGRTVKGGPATYKIEIKF